MHTNPQRPASSTQSAQSMLAQSQYSGVGWGFDQGSFLGLPKNIQQYHKRGSSGSSVTSGGPPSPLDRQTNLYQPRIATSESHYSPSRYEFDFTSPQTAKAPQALADGMIFQGNPAFAGMDMRRINSQGASVSTMSHQNSPATPHTYEEYDDKFSGNFNSMAYQQSLHEVFPDQQQMFALSKMNNHRQSMMQDRIHAAQQDHLRTQSPTSNPRENSPFRQSSPYVRPPQMQAQQQQQQQQMPQLHKQRTSISPKELMLDDHEVEDNQPSLFADSSFQHRRQPHHLSNFYTASAFNTEPSVHIPQTYPFVSQAGQSNILADSTPDFHVPMLSMESTNEEDYSSQQSVSSRVPPPKSEPHQAAGRPVDTSSDAGVYSCTYHGCPKRFDSPAKLQKHKREAHRQHDNASPSLALRNSQAGPHKCMRINPSTGKPCASIFSRPYDLTRHEDTIHNNKKSKIQCVFCQEPKLFSRRDALTRHLRVVHPDVEFSGKQRRSNKRS